MRTHTLHDRRPSPHPTPKSIPMYSQTTVPRAQCPVPSAQQCPVPSAQCPVLSSAQCPVPSSAQCTPRTQACPRHPWTSQAPRPSQAPSDTRLRWREIARRASSPQRGRPWQTHGDLRAMTYAQSPGEHYTRHTSAHHPSTSSNIKQRGRKGRGRGEGTRAKHKWCIVPS
jgi:hypothetical protein